jgi:epoxyqueuosine reductase
MQRLEQAGFRAAFLPIGAMEQVREHYDTLLERGPDTDWLRNGIAHFRSNQPPKLEFEPRSILVTAHRSAGGKLVLHRGGGVVEIPVPPNCVTATPPERWVENILPDIAQGWRLGPVKGVSVKLLAALSGLGQYGRNNICYVGDWGSYAGLYACYTDIPYDGPVRASRRMEACETCDLCRKACPTGAVGDTQVIDASHCLSFANNGRKGPMPRWVPKDAHHTLIECLRCQECCPENPPIDYGHTLELDEAETKRLLSRNSKRPEDLAQKFREFGMGGWDMRTLKRNARLTAK